MGVASFQPTTAATEERSALARLAHRIAPFIAAMLAVTVAGLGVPVCTMARCDAPLAPASRGVFVDACATTGCGTNAASAPDRAVDGCGAKVAHRAPERALEPAASSPLPCVAVVARVFARDATRGHAVWRLVAHRSVPPPDPLGVRLTI